MALTSGVYITATETYPAPTWYGDPPLTTAVTWINLGPLTATFTPPASCAILPFGELEAYNDSGTHDGLVYSGSCAEYNSQLPAWLGCQPYGSQFAPLWYPLARGVLDHIHVPGPVLPFWLYER